MLLHVASWQIECDPTATQALYATLPIGTGCSCDQCLNFNAAAGETFPKEFITLANSLGFDLTKPSELLHWCREPSGLYLTGGWFHFVGQIISGGDSFDSSGSFQFRSLAPDIEIGFTRQASLVADCFSELAVCQLEFQTRVPWVLKDIGPPPGPAC